MSARRPLKIDGREFPGLTQAHAAARAEGCPLTVSGFARRLKGRPGITWRDAVAKPSPHAFAGAHRALAAQRRREREEMAAICETLDARKAEIAARYGDDE